MVTVPEPGAQASGPNLLTPAAAGAIGTEVPSVSEATEVVGTGVRGESRPSEDVASGDLRSGLLAAAVRVAAAVLASELALKVFPLRGFPLTEVPKPPSFLTRGFFNWDAVIYQLIAVHGYVRADPSLASFFPLYPELSKAIAHLPVLDYRAAALVVSWVALFFAAWGIVRLARNVLPGANGSRAAWLLCFAPASVFFVAGYADGLFVAFFVWSLVALSERRPWLAAGLSSGAGLTRPEGALLALGVVIWELIRQNRSYVRAVALLVVSELGTVAFSVFVWVRYDDPFEAVTAQRVYWHQRTTWPLHTVFWSIGQIVGGHVVGPGAGNIKADLVLDDAAIVGAIAGFAVLAYLGRKRRDFLWLLIPSALILLVIVTTGTYGKSPDSAARYVQCLPPLLLLPCYIRSERLWTAVIVVSAMIATFFGVVYNLGGWFT